MSDNQETNEPEVGAEQEHAPRVARSASSEPLLGEAKVADGDQAIKSRPAVRRPGTAPRARRMSLSVTRVDAWSVAKVAFLLSIAGAIIQIVAAGLVWVLLDLVGLFDQVTQIVSSTGLDTESFDLANVFSLGTVLSAVTIFTIIEIVVITLLATIGALLYNVVASLVGGVHVTLGDD